MAYKGKYYGLSQEQVGVSRQKHGINQLTPPEKTPLWVKFLQKFKDPFIVILIVAGLLSLGVSAYEYIALNAASYVFLEPLGILIAVLLATGLAFIFENSADKQFAVLNKINDDEPVAVVRDGNIEKIRRIDVVVGDVIVVSAGDEVPADSILLESTQLSVDESSLTGEQMCSKSADRSQADERATYDSWQILKGTKVLEGHCIAQVTAVGNATECGKVQKEAQIDNSVKTPLAEQLDWLGNKLSFLGVGVAVVMFASRFAFFLLNDDCITGADIAVYFLKTLMTSVSLIVMAVPEGLPMAVTLSLAYSMKSMLSTNNLVRRMHACETMGATTVICTDKTGTLTANQMRVEVARLLRTPSDPWDDELTRLSLVANASAELDYEQPDGEPPVVVGNPTEGALLFWCHTCGRDYRDIRQSVTVVSELPFSQVNKYMSSVVRTATGAHLLLLKGAPEIVKTFCSSTDGDADWATIESGILALQARSMRTLGFAYKEIGEAEVGAAYADGKVATTGMRFLGYVGIMDPVRGEVPDAIATCHRAGIEVKMVTGDSVGVATEIGRQIGLVGKVVAGPDLAKMSDEELRDCVGEIKIIARARPMDKKRLVEALQARGEVVAVTGDGTNDAPAMKAAHVGLSMGSGTATAKEASDITIVDNSFASIGRAVLWGRSLYKNIQRFILFQMTVNVSACLIMAIGMFISQEIPLTVTQMLWMNLIMDTFAAMALASLPPAESVMNDKPRDRRAFIISRDMSANIFVVGCLLTAALLVFYNILLHNDITSMADFLCGRYEPSAEVELSVYEASLFFNLFALLHFWNMFNTRAFQAGRSAFDLRGCHGFLLVALMIIVGQVLIVQFGGTMFGTSGLSATDWAVCLVVTLPVLLLGEVVRLLRR